VTDAMNWNPNFGLPRAATPAPVAMPADLFRAPPHKLPGPLLRIGSVEVRALRDRIAQVTADEWAENALRQQTFSVHRATESLVLKWCANNAADTPVETRRHWAEFESLLQPVLQRLQQHYGYAQPVVRKAMFAKLKAGGEIPEHTDAAVALRMVHRVHIPIVTNDQVHFFIDGVDHKFGEGEMIELDNTRFHAVKNDSPVDRIHLIVDYYHA